MPDFDPHYVAESLELSRDKFAQMVPDVYAQAHITVPEVTRWVDELVAAATAAGRPNAGPVITTGFKGPSLLLLGPTGTGKTFEGWGALRALSESGVRVTRWRYVTAADLYARMRPRAGVDAEEVFEAHAHAPVLVLDDIGAAKGSEWTEEVNYRLINHRYQHRLPTLITANISATELRESLGQRVTSRLREMAYRVAIKGEDRRRAARWLPANEPGALALEPAADRSADVAALLGRAGFGVGLPRTREPADPNRRAEHMERIRAELRGVRVDETTED